jgi:hypothetical protein
MTEYTISIRGFESGLTEEGVEAEIEEIVGDDQVRINIEVDEEVQDD